MRVLTSFTLAAVLGMVGSSASAQSAAAASVQPGRLALMPTATNDAAGKELASALDPVVLAQLEAVVGVTAAARVALDLPAMQIALDCVGETPECLRAVTTQSNTDSLLAPSVESAGKEQVVTLLYFDARGQGELRSVVRRHHGPDVQRDALDAVPGMLRELFGVAEPATAQPEPTSEPAPVDESAIEPQAEPEAHPFPIAPVIVGGVGVVLIGVGSAFGLAANSSEDQYAGYDPTIIPDAKKAHAEADRAADAYDHAHTQALISNVMFGVGAAAVAAGAVWLVVALSDGGGGDEAPPPQAMLTPRVAPGQLGLTLHGSL